MKWTIAIAVGTVILALITPTTAWTTDLSITSENRTVVLVLGSEQDASDKFDSLYDVPCPPPPPSSSFDAYFRGSGLFEMLQTDVRSNHTWTMVVQSQDTFTISWGRTPVPLTMIVSGAEYALDASGSLTQTPGDYQITIQTAEDPSGSTSASSSSAAGHSSEIESIPLSSTPGIQDTVSETKEATPSPTMTSDLNVKPEENTSNAIQVRESPSATEDGHSTPGFGIWVTVLGLIALVIYKKWDF